MIESSQPRTARLTTALVICTVNTLAVTALVVLLLGLGLHLLANGARFDNSFGMLLTVIGIGLGCLATLMWVSAVRLWLGSSRAARPLVYSLAISGSFIAMVIMPPLVHRANPLVLLVLGALVAGTASGAYLLAAATKQTPSQAI